MTRYDPDNLPEYNEALMCPDCQEKSEVIVGLYGMFGGAMGPYTMCADCGKIVSKTYDSHEAGKPPMEIENGSQNPANDKDTQGNKS